MLQFIKQDNINQQDSEHDNFACKTKGIEVLQSLESSKKDNELWKNFIRKNMLKSILINLIFNTCYPYFNIKNPDAVALFRGDYCFARFILPMAFLLPFMMTFDMLKKSFSIAALAEAGFVPPANFSKYKYIFRYASINGSITLLIILLLMLLLEFFIPESYYFDGRLLSVFMGISAALLSIVFTLWPIRMVRKMSK